MLRMVFLSCFLAIVIVSCSNNNSGVNVKENTSEHDNALIVENTPYNGYSIESDEEKDFKSEQKSLSEYHNSCLTATELIIESCFINSETQYRYEVSFGNVENESESLYPLYWIYADTSWIATFMVCNKGALWAWGLNEAGTVGDGTFDDRYTPVLIMENIVKVVTNNWRTNALCIDGYLWAWGSNFWGVLGDGYETMYYSPNVVLINNDRNAPIKILENVATFAVGSLHTLAVQTDGSLWAWGFNGAGNLGDGTTVLRVCK